MDVSLYYEDQISNNGNLGKATPRSIPAKIKIDKPKKTNQFIDNLSESLDNPYLTQDDPS